MPKPTSANTYTGDFRFAPKMDVGNTNSSPPNYLVYVYKGDDPNMVGTLAEHVSMKNASALAVSATLALAAATLF